MAKTIKVIDLLNKIANGEIVPEKILYKEKIFEFDKLEKCYITSNFDNTVMNDLGIYLDDGLNMNSLNDTVEIIEEQQDIDIQKIEEIGEMLGWALISLEEKIEGQKENINFTLNFFGNKINDLIKNQNKILQAVKQLDRNIKDKE